MSTNRFELFLAGSQPARASFTLGRRGLYGDLTRTLTLTKSCAVHYTNSPDEFIITFVIISSQIVKVLFIYIYFYFFVIYLLKFMVNKIKRCNFCNIKEA